MTERREAIQGEINEEVSAKTMQVDPVVEDLVRQLGVPPDRTHIIINALSAVLDKKLLPGYLEKKIAEKMGKSAFHHIDSGG